MTDESRALTEAARDLYGREVREDPRAEPIRQADTPSKALDMESALEALRASREVSPEPERAPAESRHEAAHEAPADAGLWSTEEAEDLASFQQEAAQLEHDLALFARARQLDLAAVEKTDKAKAEALRTQLREAEEELTQRHQRLQGVAERIAATAQARQQQRLEQHLDAEQRKLAERVPDLDKSALVPYLRRVGFSDEEIAQAADARLIELAWKAHLWDSQQAGKRPGRVVTKRGTTRQSTPRPRGKVADARARFQRTHSIDDAAKLLQAQREANNA